MKYMGNLKTVSFQSNQITSVRPGDFYGCDKLVSLSLGQ